MQIGIIKEGKNPPDKRVPLSPKQCVLLKQTFGIDVVVQKSEIRAFTDDEYRAVGISVVDDLSQCDIIMGVKEVPIAMLIPNKMFFFFSHTYKMQSYNRGLLKAIIEKNIQLVDYEKLTDQQGNRIVAFGKWAGVVGAYNALRGWAQLNEPFTLRPAHQCHDRVEMDKELMHKNFASNPKIVLTGKGRVAGGAIETLHKAGFTQVEPKEFLEKNFDTPVFTDISVDEYNARDDGKPFNQEAFYKDPIGHHSTFMNFAKQADIYIACHYWDSKAPFIFTREDARHPEFNLKFVADISCDIDGPVASTLRPSTIANPFYGYDAKREIEVEFGQKNSIGVMAVDNLPCELPRDSSVNFGNDLLENVFPSLVNDDKDEIIWRASETKDGKLTPHFAYLQNYVDGVYDAKKK